MKDIKIGLVTVTSEEDGERICYALEANGLGTTSYSYPKNEGKIEVVLPNSNREFCQVTMPRIEKFDITDKTYETKYIPSSNVKLALSDDGKYIIVHYETELRGRIIKTEANIYDEIKEPMK